jgi:hypothetical protein
MSRPPRSAALLIAALAVLATGCGRHPLAPQVELPGGSGAGASFGAQIEDRPPPVSGQPGAIATLSLSANGAGTLRAGRFTVKIHKNSMKNPATITLTLPEPGGMRVEIQVSPPEANDFQVPIELVADLSDRPELNLDDQTIYWWEDVWREAGNVSTQRKDRTLTARTHTLMTAMVAGGGAAAAQRVQE